jgi:hypothetical protein
MGFVVMLPAREIGLPTIEMPNRGMRPPMAKLALNRSQASGANTLDTLTSGSLTRLTLLFSSTLHFISPPGDQLGGVE